jgi:mRNA interferase YafO
MSKRRKFLSRIASINSDLPDFVESFTEWKAAGGGEDDAYEFGKDSAYINPKVNGANNVLRHVHLVPIVDQRQAAKWDKKWEQHSRRTSDRVLVYVDDQGKRFLLIAVLEEPDAHDIAQMKSSGNKRRMELFAAVAEAFIYNREIIA